MTINLALAPATRESDSRRRVGNSLLFLSNLSKSRGRVTFDEYGRNVQAHVKDSAERDPPPSPTLLAICAGASLLSSSRAAMRSACECNSAA
jgi:hypothetical protein